ncbi:MAG: toxin-antitoxin system HicB family antitoxin [Planctomycetaceae bacterium]
MSTLVVHLPESLHKNLQSVADREGVSIDQFVTTSVAEKMSALMTQDYLTERAANANREQYVAALAEVPDVEPDDFDK